MEYTKKIGTREEVYKSIAQRTNGGLLKSDIIEKNNNGKLIYISKKISEKMKANTSNICFFKKKLIIIINITKKVINLIKKIKFVKHKNFHFK